MGIFTPTAGGAVAATAILVYAFLTKVPFKKISDAYKNTVIMNSQIFPLIIAGFMFARFTTLTGMTDFLLDFVVGLKAPPLIVIGVVIIVYILISFPMELLPAMIITLPVFFRY